MAYLPKGLTYSSCGEGHLCQWGAHGGTMKGEGGVLRIPWNHLASGRLQCIPAKEQKWKRKSLFSSTLKIVLTSQTSQKILGALRVLRHFENCCSRASANSLSAFIPQFPLYWSSKTGVWWWHSSTWHSFHGSLLSVGHIMNLSTAHDHHHDLAMRVWWHRLSGGFLENTETGWFIKDKAGFRSWLWGLGCPRLGSCCCLCCFHSDEKQKGKQEHEQEVEHERWTCCITSCSCENWSSPVRERTHSCKKSINPTMRLHPHHPNTSY